MHPLVCQCSGRSVRHRCFCWSRFSFAGLPCLTCGTTAGDSLIKRCAKLSSSCNGISHVRFKYSKTDRSDARSLSPFFFGPASLSIERLDGTPHGSVSPVCRWRCRAVPVANRLKPGVLQTKTPVRVSHYHQSAIGNRKADGKDNNIDPN